MAQTVVSVAWFIFGFCIALVCKSANSEAIRIADLNVDSVDDNERATEFFTVHQHTRVFRRKRDTGDHVIFPPVMKFTLKFKGKEMDISLKRNMFMTSDLKLSDNNGPILHNLGRKAGIYQDMKNAAAFVVQCEDDMEHCSLRGSLGIDGKIWEVTPEITTEEQSQLLHKAVQTKEVKKKFIGAMSPPVPGTAEDESKLKQVWSRTNPKFHGKTRQKREIPANCEIVECFAIVDETVWDIYLNFTNNNETAAEEELAANYLALYTQADLHFDNVDFRRNGSCIQLYLAGVHIQKTTAESWSAPNEIALPGAVIAFVNAGPALITCGAQGNALRSTYSIDLTQCFTRKDIVWNNGDGPFLASFRTVSFEFTACEASFELYNSAVVEGYGDKVELLIAQAVGSGIGSESDASNGCVNSDKYIMTNDLNIATDELKLKNIFYFSPCSIDQIFTYLGTKPQCLRDNGFTVDDYDLFTNQTLAGRLYGWQEQCEQKAGPGSERCDPIGQNRTYLPDMCDQGIYCTNVRTEGGACLNLGRPYDGTPCGEDNAYCLKTECYVPPENNGTRFLGDPCVSHFQCNDTNAICDATTLTCQCADGFYNDNITYVNNGTCQPKLSVGESCPQNDSCLDINAVCSGVCTCLPDYYNETGACFPMKGIGQNCTSPAACRGENVNCTGSPATCGCSPTFRFYLNPDTGSCDQLKDLGAACSDGFECRDEFAVCGINSTVCECGEDYFDSNGDSTYSGFCSAKVGLGESCSRPDACIDPNAECNYVCQCKPEYYNSSGTCEVLKYIGENCTADNECRGENVECIGFPAVCACACYDYLDEDTGNCLPKKQLGAACELEQECNDTNAICGAISRQCECDYDYYDDNELNTGGECQLKLNIGETCPQADACSDPNAVCSGVCTCPSEYYNSSSVCEILKYIGDNCTADYECRGDNTECSGNPSVCACPSIYYLDDDTGDCLLKKILGSGCQSRLECNDTNAVCGFSSNVCECAEGFYDDNRAQAGGECQQKLNLGESCPQADACLDPNAECSTVCTCSANYYNESGSCALLKYIGENCTADIECRGENVECIGFPAVCACACYDYLDEDTGNCLPKKELGAACELEQECNDTNAICGAISRQCECDNGYYDDNELTAGGKCQLKLDVGETCPQADACSDPNAVCSGICTCPSEYYNSSSVCEILKFIGDNCTADYECRGDNAECSGNSSVCACPSIYYLDDDTGDCLLKKNLGSGCQSRLECNDTNAVCGFPSNVCECGEGFYDDNSVAAGGECQQKFNLGESCPQAGSCLDPNAECSTVCTCSTNYYNESGSCALLKYIGENCTADIECRGNNVECIGFPAVCACACYDYLDEDTGNCLPKKELGAACELEQECNDTNAICGAISRQCECDYDYYDDNELTAGGKCQLKLDVGETCPQADACSDPNAVCSGVCTCPSEYYNSSSVCEILKFIGDNCTADYECRGDNAECSSNTSVCACPSIYYLDDDTGNCLLKKNLGSGCMSRLECNDTNVVCGFPSNVCECGEGFYDDNGVPAGGECQQKLNLGESCPQSDSCLDPNAECSTVCRCSANYYNESGSCALSVSFGGSCNSSIQCTGNNSECSGSPATCRCPSDRYLDLSTGDCAARKDLGDACEAGQCVGNGSVCSSINNTCECQSGFLDSNGGAAGGSCVESTGNICITDCLNRADGNYQSCQGCNVYASCSGGFFTDNRPCSASLLWDDVAKNCLAVSTTCIP